MKEIEQTVYVDILFLINFSMDFLCFYITSKLLRAPFRILRITGASVIGGVYSVVAIFLDVAYPVPFLIDAAVCLLMCAFAFYKKRQKGLLLDATVYFAVSMTLGGAMTAIFNLLNRMGFNKALIEEEEGDGISVTVFAMLAGVSALITMIGGRFFKRRSALVSVKVEICHDGRKKVIDAMVDSGNLLKEPISGVPCIAVDRDELCGLFPQSIIEMSKKGVLSSFEEGIKKNIRLIPAKTAMGDKMLIGVRAETVRIDAGKGFYETDAVIAISGRIESENGSALVPVELLR